MEFDLVNNPHPHPLIFYRQGKPVGREILCSKCKELFGPPSFACSDNDCNFNIHQSCIQLPDKIPSPFHNYGYLFLTDTNNIPCSFCGHIPYGASYTTQGDRYCDIAIDVQCAIANPKDSSLLKTANGGGEFRHFSHSHPLTLHLESDPERGISNTMPVCLVCQDLIKSPSTYYFCPRTLPHCVSYTFHQECAELNRQISNLQLHSHPLFFLAQNPFSNCICVGCKTACTKFFYSCLPCNFNIHVYCISLFRHEHSFQILRHQLSYKCQLCDKFSMTGFPWLCTVCNQLAHKNCAITEMSRYQRHSSSIPKSFSDLILVNLDKKGIIDLQNPTRPHFSHKLHKLTLCRQYEDQDMHCDGCMRCISTMSQSYGCPPCGFYLHEQCATLSTSLYNFFLHPHVLSIVYIPDFVFSCALCLQYCHGFAYRCEECYYVIDIRCAAITFPFKHLSHTHPLTYYNDGKDEHECKACGENLRNKKAIGCEDCSFYLDIRCANLPQVVINRFDEHPLILAFENHDVESEDEESEREESEEAEYYCDVCEKERYVNEWFYECKICCFVAHTKCIVGDYPFLKLAKFKNHAHPLNLVNDCTKKRYSCRCCDACGDSCDGELAFECGNSNCDFSVHAFGQCYHKQLTQGQITFTMPSHRYRSISLHPDEMWKLTSSSNVKAKMKDKSSKPLSFVSQGSSYGQCWDDGVFSSIRALRIYGVESGLHVQGIQVEYEDEDGNSIWKDKHGNQYSDMDRTMEVTLNHPDEYLTSIHGWYRNRQQGIQSLTFETNQRTLGPYGTRDQYHFEVMKFSFPTSGFKIVGLHGRSDDFYLHAIGFHFVKV